MPDYFESGFTVRERSWHGKENLLLTPPESWDEARMAAGLMWEPTTEPVYRKIVAEDGTESYEALTHQLVTRDDTKAELGVVSGTFELITHAEMGHIMEAVLEEENAVYDTGGSVRDGRQVYATVLLDEPYCIKGDVDGFGDPVYTLPYFALLNSHDGTGACKGLYTQVRVVCANTVQASAADGDRHGAQFSLRHTSGVKERIEEARQVIRGARAEAARWREVAEGLAGISITDEQQLLFLEEFMPHPPAGVASDRVRANIEADRAKFMHVLNNSLTNSRMAHNGLGLVNAAIEYLDHVRGFRNADTYMGRQILTTEPMKAKAIKLVRELVSA